MLSIDLRKTRPDRAIWLAVGLALAAAAAYLLIASGVLGVGDLQPEAGPPVILFVAAGCYTLGGLLILLRRRWLWIAGIALNGLVMFTFFRFYAERPLVLFSPGGLATKAAQLLLEGVLIYIVFSNWLGARHRPG